MSTRKEVAELAGVSPTIVSYVLNNSNYVSEEKREAVIKAAKELNYYPNYLAKSLRQKKTYAFAVLTRDLRDELHAGIAYYLEKKAYERGYFIYVTSIESSQKAQKYISTFMGQQYDGIFEASNIYSEQQINMLAQSNIPIVLFQYRKYIDLSPEISIFHPQMLEASEKAVDYLIEEKGHKRIGYLTYGDPAAVGEAGQFGQGFRANGFVNSLRKHGLPVDPAWVFFLENKNKYKDLADGVKKAVADFAAAPEETRPTAFFTGTDPIAAMCIVELQKRGFKIPQDIAIVGFGNTYSSTISYPAITTIGFDCEKAASIILDMLIEKSQGKQVEMKTMELDFVKRDSA